MLLSISSITKWWRPSAPVLPIYMPGRLRTGSRPSRTWIWSASYPVCLATRTNPHYVILFSTRYLDIIRENLSRHNPVQGVRVLLRLWRCVCLFRMEHTLLVDENCVERVWRGRFSGGLGP